MIRHTRFILVAITAVLAGCSFTPWRRMTIQLSTSELLTSPTVSGFDCYFANITGSDISGATLANLKTGCSALNLGITSSLVSLDSLKTGIAVTAIPTGTSRTVEIYGVSSSLCSNTQSEAADVLFSETSEVPQVYLLGTKTIDFFSQGTVDISSSYVQGSAVSLTANCRDIWSATTTTNAPTGRSDHTGVWTGSKMIVWGGYTSDSAALAVNSGGIYDPKTDTWTPTNETDAPAKRFRHTAVWTGSKMIVWGGRGVTGGAALNSGGIYNPETDSWSTVTTTNAPAARYWHSAIWTGSKMVIWGGLTSSFGILNTGGIYDPTTNQWTATSTGENVPQARYYTSAVWTGTTMMIWGGFGAVGSSPLNTGGVFDPDANSWAASITTTNAPSARGSHAAVWTGSKMIVWGGGPWATGVNTGGVYDNSSWSATPTSNAPFARTYSTSQWTGSRMVVWGGNTDNSGGIYDLAKNSWSSMSRTDAPTARMNPASIWAGHRMIVWGGADLNTGGVYVP